MLELLSSLLYVPLSLPYWYPCDIQVNQAAKGVISSFNALVDLLESIEQFLCRLGIYTRIPPSPAMDEIVVKIMIELLSTLALATRELNQGRSSECTVADFYLTERHVVKLVKKRFGEKDVEAVLQRLDRLTHDEARTTAAQTLDVVHGLVQGMRLVMDGERAHPAC